MPTATEYICPNCGGEVAPTLKVYGPDGDFEDDLEVKPKGNVGVCQSCNMAVATVKENTPEARGEVNPDPRTAIDPEWNPRTDPGPDRPEDDILWNPDQGGSTSPEVPLEASIPEEGSTETLAPPESTVLAGQPGSDADQT